MSTRQTTPSSNLVVLAPTNSLKRALSEDADSDSLPDSKKIRLKSENTPQAKDKKKRKKKKKKTPVVVPLELPPTSTNATPASSHSLVLSPTSIPARISMNFGKGKQKATSAPPVHIQVESGVQQPEDTQEPPQISDAAESSSAIIARLNQELAAQSTLLKRHETTLGQLHQSLTCQICLDLLHKPYALAPCGHIACYNCLVAWFTSEPEEPQFIGPRKKTCPHCRATIKERPVEVWSIKDMVAGLLKSGLMSGLSAGPPPLPVLPGTPQAVAAQSDPWHNIFRYPHQHPRFHPPGPHGEPPSVEDMGMRDNEDGGIYRCLDCMNEIWDGVCTGCQRPYPGHLHHDGNGFDDEDMFDDGDMFEDSDDDDAIVWLPPPILGLPPIGYPLPGGPWWNDDDESAEERALREDSFIDDDDDDDDDEDDEGGAAAIIEIVDSDSEHGSSPPHVIRGRRAAPINRRITLLSSDDEDEDEEADEAPRSRRRSAGNRIASPVESEVIVVSDDAAHRGGPARSRAVRHFSDDDEHEDASRESSDNESITASSR
ncbi:hypothetical protein C8R44DRAFT_63361 [Mycena epipterygia]|nr:hypothetical protein C8R44DRAFT_63361 [Mycena epipterygia]